MAWLGHLLNKRRNHLSQCYCFIYSIIEVEASFLSIKIKASIAAGPLLLVAEAPGANSVSRSSILMIDTLNPPLL